MLFSVSTKFDPAAKMSLPCNWQLMNTAVRGSRSGIPQLPNSSKHIVADQSQLRQRIETECHWIL